MQNIYNFTREIKCTVMGRNKFLGRSLSLVGSAAVASGGLLCNTGTNVASANFITKIFSSLFFVNFFNNKNTEQILQASKTKKKVKPYSHNFSGNTKKLYSELKEILLNKKLFKTPKIKERGKERGSGVIWSDKDYFEPNFSCKLNGQKVSFIKFFPEDETFRIGCGYDDPKNRKIYLADTQRESLGPIYKTCGREEFDSIIKSIIEQAQNYKDKQLSLSIEKSSSSDQLKYLLSSY